MDGPDHTPRNLERERRANEVLAQALDRPVADRDAFVAAACAGDDTLRDRVLHLLSLADSDEGSLATGAPLRGELGAQAFADDGGFDPVGRRVGPHRILRPLGRGGFATVFLAERDDGTFRQQVAIKILHAADAAGVVSRFEQERRILASLTHPNIAGLIDGGTTEWGRPFVAVEYVDGVPIDRYCDEYRLSIADRLRLFLDVTGAVEHAHRRLIVHRDLKPSNILVTDRGQVKLLDFGIAKLLDPGEVDDATPVTRTASVWLTPRYASPEQLLAQPITTAADVYQLGVLLFEILTGCPAFASGDVTPAGLVDSARERTSVRPSAAFRTAEATVSPEDAASRRGLKPAALVARLRGDLDSIVMMATRPEPERRYGSVELAAADIRAHLETRPVSARGDSLTYRARKFAERNRLAVVAAVLFALAGTAFAVGITWGFVRAERERKRAEAVSVFLQDTLSGAQPHIARGRDTTLLEAIVDDAAGRIAGDLAGQSYARAEMHVTIARTYRLLSRYEDAAEQARAAEAGFTEVAGPDAPETLGARNLVGLTHWDLGEFEEAERVLDDVRIRATRALEVDDPLMVDIVTNLGLAIRARGRLAEAEPVYREALDRSRQLLGSSHGTTIAAMSNLAFLLTELDRLDDAEALAREAAELGRAHLGADYPDTWLYVDKLASLIGDRGRPGEALPLHLEAYAGMQKTLGPRHSTTLGSAYNLSRVQRSLERYDESLETIEAILPILREEFGADSRYVLFTQLEKGRTLLAMERPREAFAALDDAVRISKTVFPPEHYHNAILAISLAEAHVDLGRPERAGPLLRDARTLLEETFGADGVHRHFDELRRVEERRRVAEGSPRRGDS